MEENKENCETSECLLVVAPKQSDLKHDPPHPCSIDSILDYGQKLCECEASGMQPLHLAVRKGDVDMINELLAKDSKIDTKDEKGRTALHLAMYFEDEEIMELLINAMQRTVGALEENLADDEGLSYLHILCTRNDPDLVLKVLKSSPASLTSTVSSKSKSWPGYSALHFAIEFEWSSIVKLLLKNGAMDSIRNHLYNAELSPLEMACSQSTDRIQRRMHRVAKQAWDDLEEDEDFFTKAWLYLLNAIDERKSIVDQLLVRYQRDEDEDNSNYRTSKESALIRAMQNGYVSFDQLPVEHDVMFDSFEFSIVLWELELAQRDVVLSLLHSGAPITPRIYDLAAELVVQHYDRPLLDLLMDHRADPNFTFDGGQTLLHKVCEAVGDFGPMVECLLKNGARSDVAVHPALTTPLHTLAKNGSRYTMEALLYHRGCGCGSYNSSEESTKDCSDNYCRSLDGRFNVDAQDELGNTPLFYAVQHTASEDFAMLSQLVTFGCDLNVENDEGTTALSSLRRKLMDSPNCSEAIPIVAVVSRYLLKLQTADCFVSKKVREEVTELVKTTGYLEDERVKKEIVEKLKNEVDRLKEVRIDSFTNLHSLLVNNVNKIAYYSKSDRLKRILNGTNFKDDFPEYGELLRSRFVGGAQRRILLEKARSWKISSANGVQLPDVCLDKVLQFLNDSCLRKINQLQQQQQTEAGSADSVAGMSTGTRLKRKRAAADEAESINCCEASKRIKLL